MIRIYIFLLFLISLPRLLFLPSLRPRHLRHLRINSSRFDLMARPRQTQSYLRGLFARHGVAPRHRYGQNFLIDLNIHDLIVKAAGVGPDDVVLEVGPGAGALTALMAATGAAV